MFTSKFVLIEFFEKLEITMVPPQKNIFLKLIKLHVQQLWKNMAVIYSDFCELICQWSHLKNGHLSLKVA